MSLLSLNLVTFGKLILMSGVSCLPQTIIVRELIKIRLKYGLIDIF